MTTLIEYALMSGASYISTRAEISQFPVPDSWSEIVAKRALEPSSGFRGHLLHQRQEIVISFAQKDGGQVLH